VTIVGTTAISTLIESPGQCSHWAPGRCSPLRGRRLRRRTSPPAAGTFTGRPGRTSRLGCLRTPGTSLLLVASRPYCARARKHIIALQNHLRARASSLRCTFLALRRKGEPRLLPRPLGSPSPRPSPLWVGESAARPAENRDEV
jgi:hypothetical protein